MIKCAKSAFMCSAIYLHICGNNFVNNLVVLRIQKVIYNTRYMRLYTAHVAVGPPLDRPIAVPPSSRRRTAGQNDVGPAAKYRPSAYRLVNC